MATLDDLLDGGELEQFDPILDPGEQPRRIVAIDQRAHGWCFSSCQLGFPPPAKGNDPSVRAILSTYCAGRMLLRDAEVRRLRPDDNWVWEFKTRPPDAVRIFGWVYRPTAFIACLCRFRREISANYAKERAFVQQYRRRLPLDEPKTWKLGSHDDLFGAIL